MNGPRTTRHPNDSRSVLRFDRVERAAHWANALLFGILMLTALPLYFSGVAAIVGRRALVVEIHLWSGIALPVPLLISLAGPWGARLRSDIKRFSLWTAAEIRWLRSLGRRGLGDLDKFNPGQKLNALFTGSAIVVMLASGSVLKWFDLFPLGWRSGATFVHDVFAAAIFLVVFGHIAFALTHPAALRSMISGKVSESWARRHAPAWLREMKATGRGTGPTAAD